MSKKFDKLVTLTVWFGIPGLNVEICFTRFDKGKIDVVKQKTIKNPSAKNVGLVQKIITNADLHKSSYSGKSHLSFCVCNEVRK